MIISFAAINLFFALTINYLSLGLAEPILNGGSDSESGILKVELDGKELTASDIPANQPVLLPVEPRFRTVKRARLLVEPPGATNYKCFLISSNNRDAKKYLSQPFTLSRPLDRPFKRADSLYCYDFPRDDAAYILFSSDKTETSVLEVDASESPSMQSLSRDRSDHVVYSAHILQAPSPETGCALVKSDGVLASDPFTVNDPLPKGLNPLAISVICATLPPEE